MTDEEIREHIREDYLQGYLHFDVETGYKESTITVTTYEKEN